MESKEHEKRLNEAIKELRAKGYYVVNTRRKIPDAVACKDGKIFAVEMMGQRWTKNRGWVNKHTKRQKERDYGNYAELLYFTFRYRKKT